MNCNCLQTVYNNFIEYEWFFFAETMNFNINAVVSIFNNIFMIKLLD